MILEVPARPGLAQRAGGRLAGRVAVVTGAGDAVGGDEPGIGHAIAVLLAVAGARVAVIDRDPVAAAGTVERIRAVGGDAEAFDADVMSTPSVDAALQRIIQRYGGVDVVVNNAAILGGAPTLDSLDSALEETLQVNLLGGIRVARASAPFLSAGSSLVFISSLGAIRTFGKLDYEASKGGINSIVGTLAVELGERGIRVNAVSPGQVWTPMGLRRLVGMGMTDDEIAAHRVARARGVPLRREGVAWDVASAVLFLASDDAAWVTGEILNVDAGQSRVVGYLN